MTGFDPKVYRNSKDGIGSPGDAAAANSTDDNTLVALAKKMVAQLAGTLTVTAPVGSATAANQATEIVSLASIDAKLTTLNFSTDTLESALGIVTETAPASDTASSGLNGRLQRVAQRITSLIALVPASLGAKTATASFAVTLATDDAAVTTLGATADAAVTAGATGSISAKLRSISRDIIANIVLAAGTNLIGRAVADASAATGGIASTGRLLSAAGTSGDATNVKASAGRLYAIQGYNAATSVRYLKLYNSASAPTAGSGTPVKTLALPPSVGFAFDWPLGYSFSTGIGFTLVTGSADNSSTSVTAADILGLNLDYV